MNTRIERLRKHSQQAVNRLSAERALLITEFYAQRLAAGESVPVQRARAFAYILAKKSICINPGELIVGERGPAPRATPTYPEICLHSLEDLDTLHTREKVSFQVDDDMRQAYRDTIIPFWQGRTQRDKLFHNMSPEWLTAFEAGVFTEFQEQRAPGHTVLGDKIYKKGMRELQQDIDQQISLLDFFADPQAYDKREELKAMRITTEAIIHFAERHAAALDKLAITETDTLRQHELQHMANVCRRVPAHAPQTFHEALQYYWFVHVGVITELNPWDSFNPGRLDQHLYPFYEHELAAETLTQAQVKELLQAFWIKFNNHPAPPKIGVTAKESSTYTDFALINTGGLTPDGQDAVNPLTYLILDVIEEMRLLQPSSMIQVSKKNPDAFIRRTVDIIQTGFGQPSVFNSDAIIQELLNQGKTLTDARKGGASGCIETGAFGHEAYFLTGYFNLPKVLEITLHNGRDPRTGHTIGLETGEPNHWKSFEEVLTAFRAQLSYFIDIKIKGNNLIEQLYARHMPVPFLSVLIDDCIINARDYNAGGARYNTSYIQGVGTGSISDMLAAIRYQVFDKQRLTMAELLAALQANFEGYEELRHQLVYQTPKYGNDDDYADVLTQEVFQAFHRAVDGRPTPRGGVYRINLLPTTSHVYFGSVMHASADGRLAGEPLSEGISPAQGADRHGPTAVLRSAAKIDHLQTGGTLLNQKFAPAFFDSEAGKIKLVKLIRTYFRMDGHHIQFNVVTADTLKAAQQHPEKYTDLIVRVAGYSDYFNDLSTELQNEIIRRTEHEDM